MNSVPPAVFGAASSHQSQYFNLLLSDSCYDFASISSSSIVEPALPEGEAGRNWGGSAFATFRGGRFAAQCGASDGESLQRFHERSAGLPVWCRLRLAVFASSWTGCVVRPPELSIAALRRFLRQCYAGGCFHDPSPLPQHSTMTFKASAQLRPPTVQPAAFTHSCPSDDGGSFALSKYSLDRRLFVTRITVAHHHGHSSRVPDSINSTTTVRQQWQHTVIDSQTMNILFSSARHKAQQTDENQFRQELQQRFLSTLCNAGGLLEVSPKAESESCLLISGAGADSCFPLRICHLPSDIAIRRTDRLRAAILSFRHLSAPFSNRERARNDSLGSSILP
ncbi:hypothetical protein KC347_g40 [Hortaea werneckii]|nr:hypothetical protein KC347_g40 [Hortaea werneckii]